MSEIDALEQELVALAEEFDEYRDAANKELSRYGHELNEAKRKALRWTVTSTELPIQGKEVLILYRFGQDYVVNNAGYFDGNFEGVFGRIAPTGVLRWTYFDFPDELIEENRIIVPNFILGTGI